MFSNKFFRLFLLFIFAVFPTYGQVNAASIDWDDIEVESAVYDSDEEELSINFQVEDVSSEPDEDYELIIEIDNDEYDKNFRYDDDEELLYAKFTIDIDTDDIEDEYEIDYEIIDEDEDRVADDDISFDVETEETEIDWDDLKVESAQFEDDELTIIFQIEDISSEPSTDYEMTIELDNEDYSEDFRYDDDDEILYAKFVIDIDSDDIEEDYDIDYEILDEDEDRVADDDISFDVEKEKVEIDWDTLSTKSALYDDDDEKLTLIFQIRNIPEEPEIDYEMTIEFDGDDYTRTFDYNSHYSALYAEFLIFIDEDDIENEYEVEYVVVNENDEEVAADDIDIEIGEEDNSLGWEIAVKSAEYDDIEEELILECVVEDIYNDPNKNYRLIIDLDGEQYTKFLNYRKDDEEIYGKYTIDIDKGDIEDEYEMDYIIIDGENEVADSSVEFEVETNKASINFSEIVKKSATYDSDDEMLNLIFQIEDIFEEPSEDYEMIIEFDNDDYNSELKYDEDNNILYSEFNIEIYEDDLEDEYDIDYIITNEDNDEVSDGSIEFEMGESLSWNRTKISSGKYDLNTGKLFFSLYLDNVSTKPYLDYSILLRIDGETLEGEFEYDIETKKYIADFSIDDIDEEDVENKYVIEFKIEDEKGKDELNAKGNLIVKTTYIVNYVTVGNDENDDRENEISDAMVSAANRVIKRVAKSKKTDAKIADNLEYLVEKLTEIADRKRKFRPIVNDLNYLFEKAIEEYRNF